MEDGLQRRIERREKQGINDIDKAHTKANAGKRIQEIANAKQAMANLYRLGLGKKRRG